MKQIQPADRYYWDRKVQIGTIAQYTFELLYRLWKNIDRAVNGITSSQHIEQVQRQNRSKATDKSAPIESGRLLPPQKKKPVPSTSSSYTVRPQEYYIKDESTISKVLFYLTSSLHLSPKNFQKIASNCPFPFQSKDTCPPFYPGPGEGGWIL